MNVLLTECVQPKSPRPGLGVGYPPKSLPIRIGVPCTGLGPLLWEGQEPPSFLSSALSFASGTSHREFTLQLVKPLTIWSIASSALPGFQKLISANIPLIVQVLLEDGLKIHTGGMTRAYSGSTYSAAIFHLQMYFSFKLQNSMQNTTLYLVVISP